MKNYLLPLFVVVPISLMSSCTVVTQSASNYPGYYRAGYYNSPYYYNRIGVSNFGLFGIGYGYRGGYGYRSGFGGFHGGRW